MDFSPAARLASPPSAPSAATDRLHGGGGEDDLYGGDDTDYLYGGDNTTTSSVRTATTTYTGKAATTDSTAGSGRTGSTVGRGLINCYSNWTNTSATTPITRTDRRASDQSRSRMRSRRLGN